MEMCRGALLLLLLPAAAAQTLLNPSEAPAIFSQASADAPALLCQVAPLKPILTFGLRLQAGYTFRFPWSLYEGAGNSFTILTTVASETDSAPVYLVDRLRLPPARPTTGNGESSGSFFVGEGHYKVEWLLVDDAGRVCRKHWEIDAQLGRNDRDLKLGMPPGSVTDLSLSSPAGTPPYSGTRRITVLLDAAPLPIARRWPTDRDFSPGLGGGRGGRGPGGRMPPPMLSDEAEEARILKTEDQLVLLGTLSALLEQLPSASVRVVAFNLEQQKELYRAESFRLESLNDLGLTLNQLQLATIDYRVLQNRTGHLNLLAGMVNHELRSQPPSDLTIVLGPRERLYDKIPDGLFEDRRGPAPRFYFLALEFAPRVRPSDDLDRPPRGIEGAPSGGVGAGRGGGGGRGIGRTPDLIGTMTPAPLPDTVSLAVQKLRGKTIAVGSPREFAKAIRAIDRASR